MSAPSLVAVLFVPDVDRGAIPLRGDTRVEQRANYAADVRAARSCRLSLVATQFHSLVMGHLPAKADDALLVAIRGVICRMCEAGELYEGKRGEMLSSVAFAENGNVELFIVDQWGNVVDMSPAQTPKEPSR